MNGSAQKREWTPVDLGDLHMAYAGDGVYRDGDQWMGCACTLEVHLIAPDRLGMS